MRLSSACPLPGTNRQPCPCGPSVSLRKAVSSGASPFPPPHGNFRRGLNINSRGYGTVTSLLYPLSSPPARTDRDDRQCPYPMRTTNRRETSRPDAEECSHHRPCAPPLIGPRSRCSRRRRGAAPRLRCMTRHAEPTPQSSVRRPDLVAENIALARLRCLVREHTTSIKTESIATPRPCALECRVFVGRHCGGRRGRWGGTSVFSARRATTREEQCIQGETPAGSLHLHR